jgi:16S rRNA (cytosine967-C5)-methyltransferase
LTSPLARAIDTLLAVRAGARLDEALAPALAGMESADAGRIQDVCYGVIRHDRWLEAVLARLAPRGVADEWLATLLHIALYQLAHTRTPAYAVVDGAVRAARGGERARAAGFVNAVLRQYQRGASELGPESFPRRVALDLPDWWREKLDRQWPEQAGDMARVAHLPPPMTLRVNRRRMDARTYRVHLRDSGLDAEALGPHTLMLTRAAPVERLPGFDRGWVSVQDAGAQRAAELLDVHDGMRVLDACAAPGGKTGHILELADCELTALEPDTRRLARLRSNLDRLGLRATLVEGDAGDPVGLPANARFERILADVPCSGSGVLRRHPDIKWRRHPRDLARFARTQARILDGVWSLLAPGGKLLYATCSVFAEENASRIADFLSRHADARPGILSGEAVGELTLLPDDRHDGFYYALLEKAV